MVMRREIQPNNTYQFLGSTTTGGAEKSTKVYSDERKAELGVFCTKEEQATY